MLSKNIATRIADWLFHNSRLKFNDYLALRISRRNTHNYFWKVLKEYGIGFYGTAEETGELFFLEKVLPKLFQDVDGQKVVFDVGANDGAFASLIAKKLSNAVVHCFEPNPEMVATLRERFNGEAIVINEQGLGAERTTTQLFTYASGGNSEHASLYEDVLKVVQGAEDVISVPCEINTLDNYVVEKGIGHVHYLKIDTEGHELGVLKGGQDFLSRQNVDVIQFEFNEMNVVSKVFLKDFYDILTGYEFYRLGQKFLVPLGAYNAKNEIFAYQNIIAVKKSLAQVLKPFEKFSER